MIEFWNNLRAWDYHTYQSLYNLSLDHHFWRTFFLFFARYGIVFSFLSFIYLIWSGTIKAFFCSFSAMAIAGLADVIVEIFWKRAYPFQSHAGQIAEPILSGMRISESSFPSIQTYVAFGIAMSTFLYGHKRLGSALFVIAILIGISRIAIGIHYPTDITAGAIIGILSGLISYLIILQAQKSWR